MGRTHGTDLVIPTVYRHQMLQQQHQQMQEQHFQEQQQQRQEELHDTGHHGYQQQLQFHQQLEDRHRNGSTKCHTDSCPERSGSSASISHTKRLTTEQKRRQSDSSSSSHRAEPRNDARPNQNSEIKFSIQRILYDDDKVSKQEEVPVDSDSKYFSTNEDDEVADTTVSDFGESTKTEADDVPKSHSDINSVRRDRVRGISFTVDGVKDVNNDGTTATDTLSESQRYDWLQCTRYKPPKLQRFRKKESSKKRKLGRNPRVPFTQHQVATLERKFHRTHYLSSMDVAELSTTLNLTETRVKIWFQNRRARERRSRHQNDQTKFDGPSHDRPDNHEASFLLSPSTSAGYAHLMFPQHASSQMSRSLNGAFGPSSAFTRLPFVTGRDLKEL